MAVAHVLGVILILGLAQGGPMLENGSPAFIEDLRAAGSSRIVAGWPAEDGQIPHQISLRMVSGAGAVSSCGGSIIHHNWVLTAAHCVANRLSFVVRFGLTNLTRPGYIVETTRKYVHPGYIEIWGGVQTHDIALLGFDQHISYGPYIQPCRLQNSFTRNNVYTGVRLTVSGYGLTDDAVNGGATSEILRWVHLRGITNEECRWWYNNSPVIQEQTICAEYYNDTAQSSCQGDSGGPLTLVDEDGKPTMIGVVSFGSSAGCNSPFPSAYVRPGHYHDWYLEVTGINFDWNQEDLAPESEEDGNGEDNGDGEDSEDGGEDGEDSEDGGEDSEDNEDDNEDNGDDSEDNGDDSEENGDDSEDNGDDSEDNGDDSEDNGDDNEDSEDNGDDSEEEEASQVHVVQ